MKDKILTAKGEELSRVLGEVLQPEKNKHIIRLRREGGYSWDTCVKCKKETKRLGKLSGSYESYEVFEKETCPIPDPIPLDWPNAMKYRDWAVEKFGEYDFTEALMESYFTDHEEQVTDVSNGTAAKSLTRIIAKAQPEHFLKAAALCVERSKE